MEAILDDNPAPCTERVVGWGLCEHIHPDHSSVHTNLPPSPVILCKELGGKPTWLLLNFGYHDIMDTGPMSWYLNMIFVSLPDVFWVAMATYLVWLRSRCCQLCLSVHFSDSRRNWELLLVTTPWWKEEFYCWPELLSLSLCGTHMSCLYYHWGCRYYCSTFYVLYELYRAPIKVEITTTFVHCGLFITEMSFTEYGWRWVNPICWKHHLFMIRGHNRSCIDFLALLASIACQWVDRLTHSKFFEVEPHLLNI